MQPRLWYRARRVVVKLLLSQQQRVENTRVLVSGDWVNTLPSQAHPNNTSTWRAHPLRIGIHTWSREQELDIFVLR